MSSAPDPPIALPEPVDVLATWVHDQVAVLETRAPFPSANSLLVTDGSETVLVDAGLGEPELEALAPELDRVVLTHFHFDHVVFFPILEAAVHPIVNAHEMPAFAGKGLSAFMGLTGSLRELFEQTFEPLYPAFPDDVGLFEPGDALELAGMRWETVPVPGHSPGHCLFHAPEASILFSVDVEFSGLGPWYAWPHCDPDTFEQSVEKHRPLFEAARVVATSHSPPIVEDPARVGEALDAFQAHYDERDRAILEAVQERGEDGVTVETLVREVRIFYGPHLEENEELEPWCAVMTEKHLERLANRNLIEQDGDRWVA